MTRGGTCARASGGDRRWGAADGWGGVTTMNSACLSIQINLVAVHMLS